MTWAGFCRECGGFTTREGVEPRLCLRSGRCEGAPLADYDPERHATLSERLAAS